MDIHEERNSGFLILNLSGRFDASGSRLFEEKILGLIGGGETRFVIDLSQLNYINSSGLRVFLAASKRLDSAGGKVVLCSLQEPVKEVFEIVGFYSILSILSSKDEAMNSLR